MLFVIGLCFYCIGVRRKVDKIMMKVGFGV